jgi:ElaB/YqjD/DUF883 family membrane-anchored ribosome-binding protein
MSSVANQTVVRLKPIHAGDVSDRLSKVLNSFTGQVSDSLQEWRVKARAAAKSTDGYVRSRPWQAVGAIALAGVAAGVLYAVTVRQARRRGRMQDATDATSEPLGG